MRPRHVPCRSLGMTDAAFHAARRGEIRLGLAGLQRTGLRRARGTPNVHLVLYEALCAGRRRRAGVLTFAGLGWHAQTANFVRAAPPIRRSRLLRGLSRCFRRGGSVAEAMAQADQEPSERRGRVAAGAVLARSGRAGRTGSPLPFTSGVTFFDTGVTSAPQKQFRGVNALAPRSRAADRDRA